MIQPDNALLILGNTKYATTPISTGTGPHFNANRSLHTSARIPIKIGAITTYTSPAFPQGMRNGRLISGNVWRNRQAESTVKTVTNVRSQT